MYATLNDVTTLFRDLDTSVTDAAVTSTDIDLFLSNTTAEINAKIGTLYQMPITEADNPESFKILKQLQMNMVACIIDDILNSYGEADKKPMWCSRAKYIMEELVPSKKSGCKQCEPTMKLPDANYLGTTRQRSTIKVSATKGRIFKKGGLNW